jgi:mono/diheme cytochrome c family protein
LGPGTAGLQPGTPAGPQALPRRLGLATVLFLLLLAAAASPGAASPQDHPAWPNYAKYCSQCHGDAGDGRGVAAAYMLPAPRDFTRGAYQIRTTPTGSLPTDDDIARIIRQGMPATAMPAFPNLRRREIANLVDLLKSFAPRFELEEPDPPIDMPRDPGFDRDNVEAARALYVEAGCAICHGAQGRGDGGSAPTLRDDWGQFVRAADLTRPWTFNGGPTRRDIYRSLATGLNGTPMAGFAGALSDDQLWQLVDFITAMSGGAERPGFTTLLVAEEVEGELDLALGDELFAGAEPALFPVVGQVIEHGRAFQPSVIAIEARAVYNREEIAFLLSWHDIVADTGGRNAPDVELPEEEDLLLPVRPAAPADDDPFADLETEDTGVGEDFWGEERELLPGVAPSEWSDAVALQFPRQLPAGPRRPYFVVGDSRTPVELWFVDLARPTEGQLWIGRGSDSLERSEEWAPEVSGTFHEGRWSVAFKRERRSRDGITFPDNAYVPMAFSVWDGFHQERGNKRGLTSWYHVYLSPAERPSPWPMVLGAALVVVALELLVVFWARRRRAEPATEPAPQPATTSGAAP